MRVFLCWIMLLLVTRESLGQDYSIKQISTSSGLYYEKIGDVLLSNNMWEFVTSIDYGGYLVFYEYLHEQVQKLEAFCQKYKSSDCDSRFRTIRTELNRIDDTDENMANFLGIEYANRRVKRFWNEIGSFFSSLGRGVATAIFGDRQTNLAAYDNQIANLRSGQIDIENKLHEQRTLFLVDAERKNLQIQWLEKTQGEIKGKIDSLDSDFRKDAAEKAKQIEELKKMLNETNNKLREQERKQKKLEGDVEDIKNNILKIDERIDGLDGAVGLNSLSIDLGFLLNLFKTEQENLYDVIKRAKRGELDPYVLTPLKLVEMLQEIQIHLSEEHQLPFYPSIENAQYLYNIIKIEVNLYKNKLIFVMEIPLVNYKKFGIHKMTSMPEAFAPNRFLFILPQEPFLIVDKNYDEYLLMSHDNFKKYCVEIVDQRYLCKQVDHINRADTEESCEMTLFSTGLEIPRSCNVRAIEIKQSVFLQLQKSGSWIYAAKTKELMKISCNGTRKNLALSGSGFLSISEACVGQTDRYLTIVPLLEFTKPVISNYSAELNLTNFVDLSDIDDLDVKTTKRFKNIISPFDFDILKDNSLPLTERSRNLMWLYIFLGLIIIFIAATVGFLVYKGNIDLDRVRNWVPFIPKEPTADPDDRLKVKVKLHNKDEKITGISMHEDPSSNDPEAEYLTVRFKVKKQKNDRILPADEIKNNLHKATTNTKSEENDDYLKELRKLKPNNRF